MATNGLTKLERAELSKATPDQVEQALIKGDLSALSAEGRIAYYNLVCNSMGLNPLTKPFEFVTLNGKTVLYAKRDATDQLRKIHGVSITSLQKEQVGELLVVTSQATDANGRTDTATGVVNTKGLAGENLANAMMKAETKAKRRVTLSLCGLGVLDETEISDGLAETREIIQPQRASAVKPAELPAAPAEVHPAQAVVEKVQAGKSQYISSEQRRALFQICVETGWGNDQVKTILLNDWQVENSAKIPVDKYEAICKFFKREEEAAPYVAQDSDIPW